MAALKTRKTKAGVAAFLGKIKNDRQRKDAQTLCELIHKISGEEPIMWGSAIVGFGSYHYVYASGREGDWPLIAFSPRSQSLALYLMPGIDKFPELMSRLGKFKTGKSCLHVKQLGDVDQKVLIRLIGQSIQYMKKKYPTS